MALRGRLVEAILWTGMSTVFGVLGLLGLLGRCCGPPTQATDRALAAVLLVVGFGAAIRFALAARTGHIPPWMIRLFDDLGG